jgi:hypothetical protein
MIVHTCQFLINNWEKYQENEHLYIDFLYRLRCLHHLRSKSPCLICLWIFLHLVVKFQIGIHGAIL